MGLFHANRKYNSKEQLQERIVHYFKSITKTMLRWESVKTGELDEKGEPVYKKVPYLNDAGEQLQETIWLENPSILKMCRYLGINRKTLSEYQNMEEFGNTIKNAKEIIEAYLEDRLEGKNVTGIIFNLKNNFGWKEKSEVDMSVNKKLEDVIDDF